LKYFRRRKKEKLYRQWVERAGLPPEAIPSEADKSKDVPARIDKREAVTTEAKSPVRIQPSSATVTHAEVGGDMMAEIHKRQQRLRMLYMMLGASLLILLVGLILLIVHSC
jgi:predicted nucleic acid-binding Zn ribbon protein